jgi:hypothetical protein
LEETKISGKRKCGKKLSQDEKVFLERKTNRKKPSLSRFFSTSEPTAVGDADALPSYDMGKSKIAVRELCVIHSVYSFSFKAISPTFDSKFCSITARVVTLVYTYKFNRKLNTIFYQRQTQIVTQILLRYSNISGSA